MKIGIIGTGAVGGYYGALMAKSGFEVHFLLHSDYAHVQRNGLYVESPNGDILLPKVNAYGNPADMPACDIIVVALKTTENHLLSEILPHAAKPDAILVMLQNGLNVENNVARMMPQATLIGGLCFLCSNKVGPGHIRHLDYGSLRIGQYQSNTQPAGITPALKRVATIFETAGVTVHVTDDLGRARWEKLVWNIPFNGLSVILDATTRELIDNGATRSLIHSLMLEVIGAARARGHSIGDAFAESMLDATSKMVAYKPSMKLDFEAGRRLEIETIYLEPIRSAAAVDFHMDRTRVIAAQLEYLNCTPK